MTATAAVGQGRAAAEALMVDTGRILRSTSGPVLNTETGDLVPAAATTVHTGPCRLRMPSAVETNALFGEREVTTTRFVACFPHGMTAGVLIGDIIEITESDDQHVAGRKFRVIVVPSSTFILYRGFGCEAVE